MALFSNTLQVLRHYLAMAVGDNIFGQCGTTGATTTKTYAPFLYQPNDYYQQGKYYVYVYAGTNIGVEKRVTGWDLGTYLLTVHSAYAAACDATSCIELHHIFTEDEYRKAINLAIESITDKYLLPLTDETTIRLTSTEDNLGDTVYTWEYAVPTTLLYLYRVITEEAKAGKKLTGTVSGTFTAGETVTGATSGAKGEFTYQGSTYIRVRKVSGTFAVGEDTSGATATCNTLTKVEDETAGNGKFETSEELDPRCYSIIKSYPPKLKFDEDYVTIDEDLYLRLEGHGTQPIVDDDTDVIYIPPDWLVQKAITFLPQNKIQSNELDNTYRQALAISSVIPRSYPHPMAKSIVE